jgi:hypothetical protein
MTGATTGAGTANSLRDVIFAYGKMNYYRLTAGITETSFSIAHYSILLRYNCNHFWAMSVPDEGCHGNASCALNTISTFLFQNMNLNIFCDSFEKKIYTGMDNSSTNINKRTIISHLKSFN